VLIVLQGMDTSGKDGTIRHVFTEVDPLGVRAVSFRAPVGEELEHTYLWRIHRQTPGKGEIVIFNRSHYEDVLVPRVHAMIDLAECKRRYRQINDFERMLAENGTILLKFFLHISKSEQRTRLQERIDEPNKRWKFNPRDLKELQRVGALVCRSFEFEVHAQSDRLLRPGGDARGAKDGLSAAGGGLLRDRGGVGRRVSRRGGSESPPAAFGRR
jgi:hypothetical protein